MYSNNNARRSAISGHHQLLACAMLLVGSITLSPGITAQDCAPSVPGISEIPSTIGDTLRLDTLNETTLTWYRATQGATSNLYRGDSPTDLTCLEAGTPDLFAEDTETPANGQTYFYQVNARNICGDGTLGINSMSAERFPSETCPAVGGDADSDLIQDLEDNCPLEANITQGDIDLDFRGDQCDNCPTLANGDQLDLDLDGIGDLCDTGVTSDDFNRNNLNPLLWYFINPLSDAKIAITGTGTTDAFLEISIPGGGSHDPWTTNDAARVMQYANDIDFELEAKFESPLTERFQSQGIMIEDPANHFLRFDFTANNGLIMVFAASVFDHVPTVLLNTTIPVTDVQYMRVNRTGDLWTLAYSEDGVGWTIFPSFEAPLEVFSVGVFAANYSISGEDAAAHTAIIDHFFSTATPLVPEDNVPEAQDVTPPFLHNEKFGVGPTAVLFEWNTDEPATSLIDYGLTAEYEIGYVEQAGLVYDHLLAVDGLEPDTTYHFRISPTDVDDNVLFSSDYMITTQPASQSTPLIDVWHGLDQQFGAVGQPQTWVNVMGNVSDPDGIQSLSYSLNGGQEWLLGIGPDWRRLQSPGDFNVDIDVADLAEGSNQVILTAQDNVAEIRSKTVEFTYASGTTWPGTYSIDWSTVTDLMSVVQPLDGQWTVDGSTVAPVDTGYDRLLAIGDVTWTDYEVTAPITINSLDPAGTAQNCNCYLVGFLLRWTGHTVWDDTQPAYGFFPLGGVLGYRWDLDHTAGENGRLWVAGNEYTSIGDYIYDNSGRTLTPGVTYIFKARVETTPPEGSLYSLKVWEEGETEPLDWGLTLQTGSEDHSNGSLLLLAHFVDATFGNVTVTPLNP